jgi:hypothetical protein
VRPSLAQVLARARKASRQSRRRLRVPPETLRLVTWRRMSFSESLVCNGISSTRRMTVPHWSFWRSRFSSMQADCRSALFPSCRLWGSLLGDMRLFSCCNAERTEHPFHYCFSFWRRSSGAKSIHFFHPRFFLLDHWPVICLFPVLQIVIDAAGPPHGRSSVAAQPSA